MKSMLSWGLNLLVVGILSMTDAMAADPGVSIPQPNGLTCIGTIQPRHAKDISANNFSIGCETMDRDCTIYKNWREYLGPLGAKGARIQSGWAKTEKVKGVYEWAWLDEIIPDMVAQGVKPWVCLCYGNPIYKGGGGIWGGHPKSPEALAAWDQFVAAFVKRYAEQVDEWELWNEPEYFGGFPTDLFIRTAETVRRQQPKAKIYGMAMCSDSAERAGNFLDELKAANRLHLINAITYHPYRGDNVEKLKAKAREFSPDIKIFQGENGTGCGVGEDAELKHAKWTLYRLLGDLGHDVRTSYFAMAEMKGYKGGTNTKALLAMKDDKTVDHPRISYRAMQHVTAIFDTSLRLNTDTVKYNVGGKKDGEIYIFQKISGDAGSAGGHVVTLMGGTKKKMDIVVPSGRFVEPVYIDMLSGAVYAIPAERITREASQVTFKAIEIREWPVLVADRQALPCTITAVSGAQK